MYLKKSDRKKNKPTSFWLAQRLFLIETKKQYWHIEMRQPNRCGAPDISYVSRFTKECASSNSKILGFVYIRSNLWISDSEW